jgi:hypothetical protein
MSDGVGLQEEEVKEEVGALSLYNLPADIHDVISEFLDDTSLFVLLMLSPRHITVSRYLLQQRKWRQKVIDHWARVGDLKGVQYLYSCRTWHMKPFVTTKTKSIPPKFDRHGDFYGGKTIFCIVMEGNVPAQACYAACEAGHLPIVAFLHKVGAFFDKNTAMELATKHGHLDVVYFLNGIKQANGFFKKSQAKNIG